MFGNEDYYIDGSDTLDLSSKELNNIDVLKIVWLIRRHPTITKIDLSDNNIDDYGTNVLAKFLEEENNNIVELDLAYNFITNSGAIALSKNTALRLLDLSGNDIFDEGAVAFINTSLNVLNLYGNPISKDYIAELKKHSSLQLGIFENTLTNGIEDDVLEDENIANPSNYNQPAYKRRRYTPSG